MASALVRPSDYLNNYGTLNASIAGAVSFGTSDASVTANRQIIDLTNAEANATTGSATKLFWGLSNMMWRSANYIPDATYPAGNTANPRDSADSSNVSAVLTRKSSKMSASQSMSTDNTTTPGTPIITQTFVFSFVLGATAIDVTNEP